MMRFILPVAALAVAIAALLMTPHDTRLFGLSHQQFASAAIGVSLLLWLVLSGLRSARPSDIARLATAAMTWALLLIAVTGVYAYRFEASAIVGRITGELLPSEPQVERGGEVVINRRVSGEFAIAGRVNGARVTFLFDTGASAVVLTAEDARRAGVETSRLVFDVPVATANGAAMAAEMRLDQVAVGPIVMRNVPAMVARRGALDESLLGMSFLERLKSYTVETRSAGHGGEVGAPIRLPIARRETASFGRPMTYSRRLSTRETASRNTSSPAPRSRIASVART